MKKGQCSGLSGPAGLVPEEGGRSHLGLRSAVVILIRRASSFGRAGNGSMKVKRPLVRTGSWGFLLLPCLQLLPLRTGDTAF